MKDDTNVLESRWAHCARREEIFETCKDIIVAGKLPNLFLEQSFRIAGFVFPVV